jgi:hypothetical protein
MAGEIKGRDLIIYFPINGINYPLCHAKDCKITLNRDVRETTTRGSGSGKTYKYAAKYGYSISLSGITAKGDIPPISQINARLDEITDPQFVGANCEYYDNGTRIDDISFLSQNSGSYIQQGGHQADFICYAEDYDAPGTNPLINMVVVKNGITIFQQSKPNTANNSITYTGFPNNSDVYNWHCYSTVNTAALTTINITDTPANNQAVINISIFQDAIMQAKKLPFVFTDYANTLQSGTILATSLDFDSPFDNISSFSNEMLGDGELTAVTYGVPPVPTQSVIIQDQFGDTLAIVPAPGVYNVLRFDTIDCRGWSNPDLVITE